MDNRFLLKLASRNLGGHKLRTILTITAMVIGFSAILFLVSFAFGVQNLVTKDVTGGNADVLIDVGTGNSQIIKLNDEAMGKIRQLQNYKEDEVVVNAAGRVKREDKDSLDVSFFGTTAGYMSWSGLNLAAGNGLTQADFGQTTEENSDIIINSVLMENLGITEADRAIGAIVYFDAIIPKELTKDGNSKVFENRSYQVIGVVKGGTSPSIYTNYRNFVPLESVNYSQAKVEVTTKNSVDYTRKQIENMGFKTQYIGETVAQVNQVFNYFKLILGSFGLIALIVAALGMFNTLTISLLERTKEVALMKMLGMKRHDIIKIFLTEAVVMGAFGGVMGIVAGVILGQFANKIINSYAVRAGGEATSVFSYPIWFILVIFAFAVLIGLLTGLYPARRAARINALDVLRYE